MGLWRERGEGGGRERVGREEVEEGGGKGERREESEKGGSKKRRREGREKREERREGRRREGREKEGMKLNASSCIHCICMYMSLCMYCTFSGECGGTACHSVKNSSLFFKVHPLRKGGREREGGEKERDKEREGQMKDTFQHPPPPHTHTPHTSTISSALW